MWLYVVGGNYKTRNMPNLLYITGKLVLQEAMETKVEPGLFQLGL